MFNRAILGLMAAAFWGALTPTAARATDPDLVYVNVQWSWDTWTECYTVAFEAVAFDGGNGNPTAYAKCVHGTNVIGDLTYLSVDESDYGVGYWDVTGALTVYPDSAGLWTLTFTWEVWVTMDPEEEDYNPAGYPFWCVLPMAWGSAGAPWSTLPVQIYP